MFALGLMGCGMVAQYGHIPAILKSPALTLHALYDPSPANLAAAQTLCPQAKTFTDLEAFFHSGIDAVTITSPAPAHRQNVLDAARHGKPVLCEKPLASDEGEAREMIAAMHAKHLPLYTAFCYRFSPSALHIKRLVDDGAIGTLRDLRLIYIWSLHGKYQHSPTAPAPVIQQRRHLRMLEGGPMVDCGTHQIDLATWWTDSPVAHFSAHGVWVEDYLAPDHMYLHLNHANGAHTTVEISYSYAATAKEPTYLFCYHLIGTEGLIRYERPDLFELRNQAGTQQFPCAPEKDFAGMYAAYADALRTGSSATLPSGHQGLEVIRIARTATTQSIANRYRAAANHRQDT